MITQPLARFAPVDLAELVDAAGLMTRIDRKYLVDDETSTRLLAALDPQTRALEIDGSRQSTYESVYFDTPDLLSYRMAAQARRRRIRTSRTSKSRRRAPGARRSRIARSMTHRFETASPTKRGSRSPMRSRPSVFPPSGRPNSSRHS